jgi:hypothetical protein
MFTKGENIDMKTKQNKGYVEAFNECAEDIAQLLEAYYDVEIEDMTHINELIEAEIKADRERQTQYNRLENINGGSK